MTSTKKYSAVERALAIGRKKYGIQQRGSNNSNNKGDYSLSNSSINNTRSNIDDNNNNNNRRSRRRRNYKQQNNIDDMFIKSSFGNDENLNVIDNDTINFIFSKENYNSNTPSKKMMANNTLKDNALFENATNTSIPLPTFKDIDNRIDDLFSENAMFLKENFSKSHDVFNDARNIYGTTVDGLRPSNYHRGVASGSLMPGGNNNPSNTMTTATTTDLNHIVNDEYDENVNYKLKLANLVDSLSREVEVLKNNSIGPTIPKIVSPSSIKNSRSSSSSTKNGIMKTKTVDKLYETSTGLVITVPVDVVVDDVEQSDIPVLPSSQNNMMMFVPPPPSHVTASMLLYNDAEITLQQTGLAIEHHRNHTYRKYFDGMKLYYMIRKHIFLRMKNNILSRPCRKWEGIGVPFEQKAICAERGRDAMAKDYVKQRLLKISFAKLMLNVHEGYEDFVINVLPPPLLETPPGTPKSIR